MFARSASILLLILGAACGKPPNPSAAEARRLNDGREIGRALVAYGKEHNQRLPNSLEELAPQYLGTNVEISAFTLGGYVSLRGNEAAFIASDRLPDNKPRVLILGNGRAFLLQPGA